MNGEDNKRIVRRFIEEAINEGDVDRAGDYVAEDVVELVPFPGQGPGLEGLNDVLRGLRKAFPDMHWTIEEQMAEADKVLRRFVWTGTHTDEFFGVQATMKPVKVWGMVIDRLEGGRSKETRILTDGLGLMTQMGEERPAKRTCSAPRSTVTALPRALNGGRRPDHTVGVASVGR